MAALTPTKTNRSRQSTPVHETQLKPAPTPGKRVLNSTPLKPVAPPAALPRLTIHKIVLINFKSCQSPR
jgi:hypothetical protein